jgi:hypothetical protein
MPAVVFATGDGDTARVPNRAFSSKVCEINEYNFKINKNK